MATELQGFDHSFVAGADLSASQFLIVKQSGTGRGVVLGAAATDSLIGVLQDKPKSGQPASVRIGGISKVVAGGTVNIGDPVTADGAGKGVAAAPAGGTNNWIIGRALDAAASGDIFTVLMGVQRIQG